MAFDIVGERKRTNFYKHPGHDMLCDTFEVEIRNRSEETVTVKIVDPLFRWSNWEIQKLSHEFEQTDSRTIEFPVTVERMARRQ